MNKKHRFDVVITYTKERGSATHYVHTEHIHLSFADTRAFLDAIERTICVMGGEVIEFKFKNPETIII